MNVQSFLTHIRREKTVPSYSVICFLGKIYPLLFFSYIISFLNKNGLAIHRIDLNDTDASMIKAQLSMTGFGGNTVYWLNGFHMLTPKKQQEWNAYIQSYVGPHKILYFSHQEIVAAQTNQSMLIITLPDELTPNEFSLVHFLVTDKKQEKTDFATRLATRTASLSLDTACLFALYEVVLGKSGNSFFSDWIPRIIESSSSLFGLSQHFFGKKSQLFFEQWSRDSENYLPPFWANFWADQIWRAYVYCSLMKKKQYAQAKKAQYKLPFSFINRDWSLYSLTELRNAHHFLSGIDFHLKNGGSCSTLELFYGFFFQHKFK